MKCKFLSLKARLSLKACLSLPTCLLLTASLLLLPVQAWAGNHTFRNEILQYDMFWEIFHVGSCVLRTQVLPPSNGENQPAGNGAEPSYRFSVNATTNDLGDLFLEVRDLVVSETTPGLRSFRKFRKYYREGDYLQHYALTSFPARSLVRRDDHAEGTVWHTTAPGQVHDVLSVLHAFRDMPLQPATLPVTDGKRVVNALMSPIETQRQSLHVGAGTFPVFLVSIDLQGVDGIFKSLSRPTMRVWVSNDEQRIPLRLESTIKIGPFIGDFYSELVRVDYGPDILPAGLTGSGNTRHTRSSTRE